MSETATPQKKKGVKARLSKIYDYDSEKGTIKLKNRKCPRCSSIMGFHKSPSRWACGGCSYTDFLKG